MTSAISRKGIELAPQELSVERKQAIASGLAYVAAAVLLFAAYRKIMLLCDPAWRFVSTSQEHWFLTAIVVIECLIGWGLILGGRHRGPHLVGLILFFAFTYYQFYLMVKDQETCNCFGDLEVSTSALLVVDVVFSGLFLCSLLTLDLKFASPKKFVFRSFVFASAFLILVASAGWLSYPRIAADRTATDYVGPQYRLMKPGSWIGKRFPHTGDIEPVGRSNAEIASDGLVLVVRDGCGHCEKVQNRLTKTGLLSSIVYLNEPPDKPFDGVENVFRFRKEDIWVCKVPLLLEFDSGVIRDCISDESLDSFGANPN